MLKGTLDDASKEDDAASGQETYETGKADKEIDEEIDAFDEGFDYSETETVRLLLAANTKTIPKLSAKLKRIQRYLRQPERQKANALRAWQRAKKQEI